MLQPVEYPLVVSFFCTEFVTPTRAGWRENIAHLVSLVADGGWLFLVGAHDSEFNRVGPHEFTVAPIAIADVRARLLELGFDSATIKSEVIPGIDSEVWGLREIFLACAKKQ